MLHVHIISVGKLKEEYWRAAEGEYLKRLQPFAKLELHEIKEESFTEKDPAEVVKEKEGKKILEVLQKLKDCFVIALEEKGKQYSSPEFSKYLDGIVLNSASTIVFIIGGPVGLDRAVVQKAKTTLSLSPLTFTHQMTRVILLEQLYRAMMISGGRRYHY